MSTPATFLLEQKTWDKLWWTFAVLISCFLNFTVVFVHFVLPEKESSRAVLEMILVNENNTLKTNAKVIANAGLLGGGDAAQGRSTSPLMNDELLKDGNVLTQVERLVRYREQELQQRLLAVRESFNKINLDNMSPEQRSQWSESFEKISRRQAEIEKAINDYNARPRKYFEGPHTNSNQSALYIQRWQDKVEEWGNRYYPEQARGRLKGDVILTVEINKNGTVASISMGRSSGHKILDQAARLSVERASPFGAFNREMKEHMDILVITRSWRYGPHGLVTSQVSS